MGTELCTEAEEPSSNGRNTKVHDADFADSESDSDSDYLADPNRPGHSPQPSLSREEYEAAQVIKGFTNAFETGNESLAIHLVDEYPELNMMGHTWPNGQNCLHVAVEAQNDYLVVFCLEEGLDPNTQNEKTGNTALSLAVQNYQKSNSSSLRIAAMLMNFGADPLIENDKDESPLTLANAIDDKELRLDFLELLQPEVQDNVRAMSMEDGLDRVRAMTSVEIVDAADTILEDDVADDDIAPKELPNMEDMSRSVSKKMYQVNSAFEKALNKDPKARMAMEAQRVQRNNPFTKMKRQNTLAALVAMKKIQEDNVQLPKLEGWLEKQRVSRGIKSYQKRWVVVKGSHMLWSEKQKTIHDPKSKAQRDSFNNFINIMGIKNITAKKTKSGNKFTFVTGGAKPKEYLWKASSRKERDHWVSALKAHQDHVKSMINYLGSGTQTFN